jgi:hypothetical protein
VLFCGKKESLYFLVFSFFLVLEFFFCIIKIFFCFFAFLFFNKNENFKKEKNCSTEKETIFFFPEKCPNFNLKVIQKKMYQPFPFSFKKIRLFLLYFSKKKQKNPNIQKY